MFKHDKNLLKDNPAMIYPIFRYKFETVQKQCIDHADKDSDDTTDKYIF